MERTLQNLKRKLEAAELEHLRQHAAELHERLEEATERADRAEECADMWWRTFHDFREEVQNELDAAGMAVGITKDGAIGVVDGASRDLFYALRVLKIRLGLDAVDLRQWGDSLAASGRAIPNVFDTIYGPLLKAADAALAKAEGKS